MSKLSWSLVCLAIGLVAYSNLLLWSQYAPTGSLGLPLALGNVPVLTLQILGLPLIFVGVILFAWSVYDWVQAGYKKDDAATQPAHSSAEE